MSDKHNNKIESCDFITIPAKAPFYSLVYRQVRLLKLNEKINGKILKYFFLPLNVVGFDWPIAGYVKAKFKPHSLLL